MRRRRACGSRAAAHGPATRAGGPAEALRQAMGEKRSRAAAAAAASEAPSDGSAQPASGEPKPLNRAQRRAAAHGGTAAAAVPAAVVGGGEAAGEGAKRKKPFMRKQKRLQAKQDAVQPPAEDCGLAMEKRAKALLKEQRSKKRSAEGTRVCTHMHLCLRLQEHRLETPGFGCHSLRS